MAQDYRRFITVYVALLLLLAATMASTLLELGAAKPAINIGIAFIKAGLVAWFFMKLRHANGLIRLFASAGLFWLLILLILGSVNWLSPAYS